MAFDYETIPDDKDIEIARLRAEGTECVQHEGYKLVWCAQCIKMEREVAQHHQDKALAQLAEAVVEALKLYMRGKGQWEEVSKALAAWEEGNA